MAIAVDLDGTLAEYHGWVGEEHIGDIIEPMKEKVLEWIEQGEEVVIFSARADYYPSVKLIQAWLIENGLPSLEVTNLKRKSFVAFYDDRAFRVERNTGVILDGQ